MWIGPGYDHDREVLCTMCRRSSLLARYSPVSEIDGDRVVLRAKRAELCSVVHDERGRTGRIIDAESASALADWRCDVCGREWTPAESRFGPFVQVYGSKLVCGPCTRRAVFARSRMGVVAELSPASIDPRSCWIVLSGVYLYSVPSVAHGSRFVVSALVDDYQITWRWQVGVVSGTGRLARKHEEDTRSALMRGIYTADARVAQNY